MATKTRASLLGTVFGPSEPEASQKDQFVRLLFSFLGGSANRDPADPELQLRPIEEVMSYFEPEGYIGRTYTPDEQKFFMDKLRALRYGETANYLTELRKLQKDWLLK